MNDQIRRNAANILAISLRFFLGAIAKTDGKLLLPLSLHEVSPTIS
jgi:hypothetical protein